MRPETGSSKAERATFSGNSVACRSASQCDGVTLPRQWEKHAVALVEQASPIEGEFFRSVEIAHGHPDDVVSGEGTRLYGGRFVRPGIRAVFGSADETTAFKESAARINRLAGR